MEYAGQAALPGVRVTDVEGRDTARLPAGATGSLAAGCRTRKKRGIGPSSSAASTASA